MEDSQNIAGHWSLRIISPVGRTAVRAAHISSTTVNAIRNALCILMPNIRDGLSHKNEKSSLGRMLITLETDQEMPLTRSGIGVCTVASRRSSQCRTAQWSNHGLLLTRISRLATGYLLRSWHVMD